jgi:hypothetical protein
MSVATDDAFMWLGLLQELVTSTADIPEIPVHDGQEAVERAYARAQKKGVPFVAIERYEEGYAFTYDLLPAGKRLTPAIQKEVRVRLTNELEELVGSDTATVEASKSVSDSLGHVSLLSSEAEARQVARAVAPVVLDEANWLDG